MIKVFLVDDHKMFKEGLKNLIEKEKNIQVVGEAENGIDAFEKIKLLKPDVAIVDISLPGINGIELTKKLKKTLPETEVLILSMHSDAYFAVNAFKNGARGYILKEDSFNLLIDTIKDVANGNIAVSPSISDFILGKTGYNQEKSSNVTEGDKLLTEREIEVLQMIAEGYTNTQIAEKLFISSGTVDTHRKNIMKKLNIHNVSGLVKYAIKHKIIIL